jgi:molecular chaperone GrpE
MSHSSSDIAEQENLKTLEEAADAGEYLEAEADDAVDLANESVETVEVLSLKSQVDQLQKQLVQQQEEFLRAQAEAQNIRRRAQKDIENAHKFGADALINALLPVVDSLEQGIAMLNADDEALKPAREGALLTLKMLVDLLAKQNVEPVVPLHQPFNPEQHQAMTLHPTDEHAPNTVLNVLQKGYLLHGRVLRPALVVVSKAATAA